MLEARNCEGSPPALSEVQSLAGISLCTRWIAHLATRRCTSARVALSPHRRRWLAKGDQVAALGGRFVGRLWNGVRIC